MTALELAENQACEAIAEAVACEHSPAVPGSHEAAGIHAAEEIRTRIIQRQNVIRLKLVGALGPTVLDELQGALQQLGNILDMLAEESAFTPPPLFDALEAVQDSVARALTKLQGGNDAGT